MNEVPHPPIVSRDRWLDARKKLLAQEKELTRQYNRVNGAASHAYSTPSSQMNAPTTSATPDMLRL